MKKVLYVILGIAVLYLVLCLVGPSSIMVERSATMIASTDAIKKQIGDFNTFTSWSPWQEKDPNMKVTIEGQPQTPGHKYSWEGNKDVGKGSMEIKSVTADSITELLDFAGKGTSDVHFVFAPEGNATNVRWIMNMNIPFFGRGMMLFMKGKMDKMLGADFEKGLANLKTKLEAGPKEGMASKYEVKEVNWDTEKYYYGTKKTNLSMDKISPFFAENLPKIWMDFDKNKIQPVSPPSCIVFAWNDSTMSGEMAAVIGGPKDAKLKGWEKYTVPAGKVLQVEYFGAYDKIGDAHASLMNYVKEKNLQQGWVIEEYVSDPGREKDTAKWQTNVYYLVK